MSDTEAYDILPPTTSSSSKRKTTNDLVSDLHPDLKKQKLAREKRPAKEQAPYLARLALPPVPEILRRLAEATDDAERIAAADELKAKTKGDNSFEESFDQYDLMGIKKLFYAEARNDYRKILSLALDVYPAWETMGKAAIALLGLKRAAKFGDGDRAFQILHLFISRIIDLFLEGTSDTMTTMIASDSGGLYSMPDWQGGFEKFKAIVEKSNVSKEEEDEIEEAKKRLCGRFLVDFQDPFAEAVKRCHQEQKRSKVFPEKVAMIEEMLARACFRLTEHGFGIGDDPDNTRRKGMGFDLFVDARDEMGEWAHD